MKSICVYLGAKTGNSNVYHDAVIKIAKLIAAHGHRLIYGGSSQGLMGVLADCVKKQGGLVTGIIPTHLIEQEKPPHYLDELIFTHSMQERKLLMLEKSDLFIVMPGGLGTLEEAFETWNAIKVGILNKPMGFLNIDGYYDELFSFILGCSHMGFIMPEKMRIPIVESNPDKLLKALLAQ